ncbi:MAG: DUF4124 domain-containing protein [Desulfobacteraceae bacterium]|nr:DUF4124 domain-containing protein [Desulfobacteraceae bacterium]
MGENSKPKHPALDSMFKSAIEKANEADIDEPPLVWPELPEDLKTDKPKESEATGPAHEKRGNVLRCLIFIVALLFYLQPLTSTAELYQWTYENGVVHYSNVKPDPSADVKVMKEKRHCRRFRAKKKQGKI